MRCTGLLWTALLCSVLLCVLRVSAVSASPRAARGLGKGNEMRREMDLVITSVRWRVRGVVAVCLVGVALLHVANPAVAAEGPAAPKGKSVEERLADLEKSTEWTKRVTLGGQIRIRANYRNNADWFGKARDRDSSIEERTWLTVGAKFTDEIDGFVRLQDQRFFGAETSRTVAPTAGTNTLETSLQSNGDSQSVNLRETFLRFRDGWDAGLSLKFGRMIVQQGRGRYVGAANENGNGRSFDGALAGWEAALEGAGKNALQAFHFRVVDGNNTERGLGGGTAARDDDRTLSGLYDEFTPDLGEEATLTAGPFLYVNRDRRRFFVPERGTGAGTVGGPLPGPLTSATYGLRAFGTVAGGAHFDLDAAFQRGQWASDQVRAHSFRLSAGWEFADLPWKPDPILGYSYATGDSDPNDGKRETPDLLYPTANYYGYGFAERYSLQNLVQYDAALIVRPYDDAPSGRKLLLKLWYKDSRLATRNDANYLATGAKFPGTVVNLSARPGSEIDKELSLAGVYNFSKGVWLDGGLAHLWPGRYIRHLINTGQGAAPAGRHANDSWWWYLLVTANF
ncbi:MAG: alginate export family protein [Planctomycetes bacterium]|nr:alginate export family protein [Planctomycetota bacterium]